MQLWKGSVSREEAFWLLIRGHCSLVISFSIFHFPFSIFHFLKPQLSKAPSRMVNSQLSILNFLSIFHF